MTRSSRFFPSCWMCGKVKKNITVKECKREFEVDSAQCVVGQTVDKLVRSLLRLKDPHGNCAVCRRNSTVHDPVGEQELQPAGRIGLHNTHAGYHFGSGGAVRYIPYLRNICKNRKKERKKSFLSVFSQISCDHILTHHFEKQSCFLLLPTLVSDAAP